MGLHKLSDSIEFVKKCFSSKTFNFVCPTSMTVIGDSVRKIQVTLTAGLNPEVFQARCYTTVVGIGQFLN